MKEREPKENARTRERKPGTRNPEPGTRNPLSLPFLELLKILLHEVSDGWRDVGVIDVVAAALRVLSQDVTIRPRRAAHRKRLIGQVLVGRAVPFTTGHKHVFRRETDRRRRALATQIRGTDA